MHELSLAHLAYLRLKRCTPATISARRYFLARLEDALGAPPALADAQAVADWYAALPGRMTARSQATELANARSFYRWAQSQQHREDDPTAMLPRPIVAPGRPRPMPTEQVMDAVAASRGRIHAGIVGAAYAGLRAIEIAAAERSWLHDGDLIVVGKGGRSRVVPAHRLVVAAFSATPGERLFPSPVSPGEVASAALVSKKINGWLHARGIDSTLHSLRHWHATQLYAGSRDLRLVQEVLGHASPQTTAVYADFARPDAAAAIQGLPAA